MYESPVNIIYGEMQTQIEGEIFKAIQNVGIDVNKEELIKALQYDREQYKKGYSDAISEFAERCDKKITEFILEHQGQLTFVSGVSMGWKIIDEIAEEMRGAE